MVREHVATRETFAIKGPYPSGQCQVIIETSTRWGHKIQSHDILIKLSFCFNLVRISVLDEMDLFIIVMRMALINV